MRSIAIVLVLACRTPEPAPAPEPAETTGELRLTAEQVAAAKIATAPVTRRAVTDAIRATGEIEAPDDGVARVGPKVAGRVSRLAKGIGDRVKKGDLLAIVDSPDLGRAKADYIAAAALAQVSRETADRERALFDKKISSEKEWRQAEADATKARAEKDAAEVRLHTLGIGDGELAHLNAGEHFAAAFSVTSPIDGVVVARPTAIGQAAQPAETMFVVMDLANVWVIADVYERDLARVVVGEAVVARVPAWQDRAFAGKVASVGAVVERKSRTIKVRIVLPNPEGALKPGMFASVEIAGTSKDPRTALFVPAGAVQRTGDQTRVFVAREAGVFEPRRVRIGQETSDWIELTDGVTETDRVVVAGRFALQSALENHGED